MAAALLAGASDFDQFYHDGSVEKVSSSALRLILQSNKLELRSENTTWRALESWYSQEEKKRGTNVNFSLSDRVRELASVLRFPCMASIFLQDVVAKSALVEKFPSIFLPHITAALCYHQKEKSFPKSRRVAMKIENPSHFKSRGTSKRVVFEWNIQLMKSETPRWIHMPTQNIYGYTVNGFFKITMVEDCANLAIYCNTIEGGVNLELSCEGKLESDDRLHILFGTRSKNTENLHTEKRSCCISDYIRRS